MTTNMLEATITDMVIERPARSRVFEQVGIKYCCAGSKTLGEACAEKGLDTAMVSALLRESDEAPEVEARAWEDAPVGELVRHIVETHHAYLKRELPRLEKMADKVAKVHGKGNPKLVELYQVFRLFAADLNMHMMKEENVLFPAILGEGGAVCGGSLANPIRVMESEHEDSERSLGQMRRLTDGYAPPDWACNTYRALFDGLRELDEDMQAHVYKENEVLFPRVLA